MIYDVIGWIGTALLVIAYFLITTKRLSPTSLTYQLMNLSGSALAGINFVVHKAYPGLGIEFFWAAIAIYGLYKALGPK